MMKIAQRVFQLAVFVIAGFMVLGGGFYWQDVLADNVTRTLTYTLYRTLPAAPLGPKFCPLVTLGGRGLVMPCDFTPPFVWWLRHHSG